MEDKRIIDKIAYQLNCLTECPNHKISYFAAAVNLPIQELIKFE